MNWQCICGIDKDSPWNVALLLLVLLTVTLTECRVWVQFISDGSWMQNSSELSVLLLCTDTANQHEPSQDDPRMFKYYFYTVKKKKTRDVGSLKLLLPEKGCGCKKKRIHTMLRRSAVSWTVHCMFLSDHLFCWCVCCRVSKGSEI